MGILFRTPKILHIPNTYGDIKFKNSIFSSFYIKKYTIKEYTLFVFKKRPEIIKEFLKFNEEKKILYATCLIISEEGGVFCNKNYKPHKKIEKLIEENAINVIKENEIVLFISSPPTDYLYEKLLESSLTLHQSTIYGKYNPPRKISWFLILFLIINNLSFIFFLFVKLLNT